MSVTGRRAGGGVARLVVPDPAALDRRDLRAGEQLRDALLRLADDDSVKVIVLAGLAGASSPPARPADAEAGAHLLYTGVRGLHQVIAYCKKIVVAEVDGSCGPTASALCLAADLAIATDASTFASPFGVAEASYVLAVLTMRANRAKAWLLRANTLGADEALAAGVVNRVVAAGELRATVDEYAARAALMSLDGITVSKMNVGAAFDVIGVGRDFDVVEAGIAAGSRG